VGVVNRTSVIEPASRRARASQSPGPWHPAKRAKRPCALAPTLLLARRSVSPLRSQSSLRGGLPRAVQARGIGGLRPPVAKPAAGGPGFKAAEHATSEKTGARLYKENHRVRIPR
jgi:hypothetical protein